MHGRQRILWPSAFAQLRTLFSQVRRRLVHAPADFCKMTSTRELPSTGRDWVWHVRVGALPEESSPAGTALKAQSSLCWCTKCWILWSLEQYTATSDVQRLQRTGAPVIAFVQLAQMGIAQSRYGRGLISKPRRCQRV